jgi:hypothetical protein
MNSDSSPPKRILLVIEAMAISVAAAPTPA